MSKHRKKAFPKKARPIVSKFEFYLFEVQTKLRKLKKKVWKFPVLTESINYGLPLNVFWFAIWSLLFKSVEIKNIKCGFQMNN